MGQGASRRFRIGVDAYNLRADRRGMGRMVRQTLRALEANAADVFLIGRNRRSLQALREESALPCIPYTQMRNMRFDAVWYPWNGMRFTPHAPSIVTVHDVFAFTFPHRNVIARLREQRPIRRAIARADCIFAVSRWTANEVLRLFSVEAARIEVVPNAPDPFWRPVRSHSRQPYMLVLGSPEPRKNIAMLLRAYEAAFDAAGPQLIVAGTLSDADARTLRAMKAPHELVHPGDEELRELYSGALAVLIPSLAEGYGLPAVEAMACEAPVIAANTAALPETCGGAALLVDLTDAAWSQALQRVARDDELRAELRRRGRSRVAEMDPAGPAKAVLAFVRRFAAVS